MPPSDARRRRNGQAQACETCRKAKIRCDHAAPACGRCVQRRLTCLYHPAPMTRRREDKYPLSPRSSSSATTTHNNNSESASQPTYSPVYATPTIHIDDSASRNTVFQKPGTPYGTTRFSAVFSENQDRFGSVMSEVAEAEAEAEAGAERQSKLAEASSNNGEDRERARMEMAINTLKYFPSERINSVLLASHQFMGDIWVSPTMLQNCHAQIWDEYGIHLGPQRCRASLSQMSRDLFANTRKPMHITEDSHWRNWFAGPLLRWEMIGIIFAWAGFVFKHLQEWDPVFQLPELRGRNSRNAAGDKMRECADACLQLCGVTGEINELMLVLMKNTWKLQSIILSDECDIIRTGSGIVGSAYITAGHHRLPPSSPDNITPLSQYRISLAASLYYLDKCDALFNGRPPSCSRHYCRWELPLDLSEEQLFSGPEKLAAAVRNLDEKGWNTKQEIYTVTWLRALCLQIPIREEILELSIGMGSEAKYTWKQIKSLITQLEEITASYPSHLQYYNLSSSSSPRQFFAITHIHLNVLQCHFLLQRLAVREGYTSSQRLLDIALEMIRLVLSLWLKRDVLGDWSYTFDWMVVCYGIPAAGVLCITILNSSTSSTSTTTTTTTNPTSSSSSQPTPTSKSTPAPSTNPKLRFSKSEIIQSLTMFIAFLAWIRPSDGNASLCWKLQRVIKRIVDGILDEEVNAINSIHQQQQEQEQEEGEEIVEDVDEEEEEVVMVAAENQNAEQEHHGFLVDGAAGGMGGLEMEGQNVNGMDDFGEIDWLNTIDWTLGGWTDFGGHEVVFQ